jgi:ectoine hydroxylase-related dioxygenase (phytanoyl-CoA dioxygenase family)
MAKDDRHRAWEDEGFFVVRDLLRPARVAALSEACDHMLAQVRGASSTQGHSTTHVAGLLAPEHFARRPELLSRLAEFMSSREVLALVHDLGRAGEGLLNLRDAHYFHEPSAREFDGDWHRDGDGAVPADPTTRATSLRFRVAFAHDDHLEVVPGSHRRADTPEERAVLKGGARNAALATPSVRIELAPGDVCVFDTWAIHRARYRRDRVRRTLDLLFGFGPRKRHDFGALQALATGR